MWELIRSLVDRGGTEFFVFHAHTSSAPKQVFK